MTSDPLEQRVTRQIVKAIGYLPIGLHRKLKLVHLYPGGERALVDRARRVVWIRTHALVDYCLFSVPRGRFIVGGDWDLRKAPILPGLLEKPHFSCIFQLYRDNLPYYETTQFHVMMAQLRSEGATERGIQSEKEVHTYFHALQRTFDDIRTNGYRSQEELGGPPENEIRITIDRSGSPLKWYHGHHRLAIAHVLGIESVPVFVQCVHSLWLAEVADSCSARGLGGLVRKALMAITHPQ